MSVLDNDTGVNFDAVSAYSRRTTIRVLEMTNGG
jgi:hypothetical protein